MTKELLKDYTYAASWNGWRLCVADTVEGSSPEFPYTKHTVRVQGVPEPGRNQEAKLAELRA